MSNDFWVEYLGGCEYGVPSKRTADQFANCGERAIARVWWKADKSDAMLLCGKHLDIVCEAEEEQNDGKI